MFLQDSSPDKNAVFMSAPHSFHLDAEQMDKTRCFVSLRKVGLSVATFPRSGSCHPTKTRRAFGVLEVISGSDDFFHAKTHLALIILSVGIPLALQVKSPYCQSSFAILFA